MTYEIMSINHLTGGDVYLINEAGAEDYCLFYDGSKISMLRNSQDYNKKGFHGFVFSINPDNYDPTLLSTLQNQVNVPLDFDPADSGANSILELLAWSTNMEYYNIEFDDDVAIIDRANFGGSLVELIPLPARGELSETAGRTLSKFRGYLQNDDVKGFFRALDQAGCTYGLKVNIIQFLYRNDVNVFEYGIDI